MAMTPGEQAARQRDASYGVNVPEHWIAVLDRRHLLAVIDSLRNTGSTAEDQHQRQ